MHHTFTSHVAAAMFAIGEQALRQHGATLGIPSYAYYVTAQRSNGETVYLCNSPTQGVGLIPFAHSMARRYASRKDARAAIAKVAPQFKGLTDWHITRELAQA